MIKNMVLTCLVIPTIGACTVGPNYTRPMTRLSINQPFINTDTEQKQQSMARWWVGINNPQLSKNIDQLLLQNLDLKQASERVIQSRAQLSIQTGQHYPTLGANGSVGRTGTPTNNTRTYTNTYNAQLETNWEIDLFGRIRRSTESASATYGASLYDHEALTHSLIAQLANQHIAIAVNKRLLTLAIQNGKNRKLTLDTAQRRYNLGVSNASLGDVLLAEESHTSVQSNINEYKRRLTDNMYALDNLLGQLPGATNVQDINFPITHTPKSVGVCLPANLIDRRPDLKAHELLLKAANADIGVAVGDLYPKFNLGASVGLSSNTTSNFFDARHLATSIIGSITNRLFDGGALRANIKLKESKARELTHAYANNVIGAVGEVESALQATQKLSDEVNFLKKSAKSIKGAEQIIENRYSNGLATLRDVLDTQQRQYQIQQSLILRQQDQWNTRIALYLALGGDWLSIGNTKQEACSP